MHSKSPNAFLFLGVIAVLLIGEHLFLPPPQVDPASAEAAQRRQVSDIADYFLRFLTGKDMRSKVQRHLRLGDLEMNEVVAAAEAKRMQIGEAITRRDSYPIDLVKAKIVIKTEGVWFSDPTGVNQYFTKF